MQRREFLQGTLALGVAGMLSGVELVANNGLPTVKPQMPIWEAAVNGHWNIVKQWLQHDPSLIAVTGDYFEFVGCNIKKLPLFHLAVLLNPDIVFLKYLVSQGADLNVVSEIGGTPQHYAARNSTVEVLEYLISLGKDINAKNKIGSTLLHYAAYNPNVEVLQYVVSQSADVNVRDDTGWTPLHNAAHGNSNIESLRYLVSVGANVHAENADGKMPCDLVAYGGMPSQIIALEKIKRFLLEAMGLTQEEIEDRMKSYTKQYEYDGGVLSQAEIENLLSFHKR